MSVATKSFKQVLHGALSLFGLAPAVDTIKPGTLAKATEYLNSAVKLAWEFYTWPDAMQLREETPIAHPTVAGAIYIPRSTADRVLKLVVDCYDADPRVTENAQRLSYVLRGDGLYFRSGCLPAVVWVDYREEPPEYTSEEHVPANSYAQGALAWDKAGTGHVYRALAAVAPATALTDTTKWQPVPVLACLAEPVKAGVLAALRSSDGEHGTAAIKEGWMLSLLEHEILQIENQAGAGRTWSRG